MRTPGQDSLGSVVSTMICQDEEAMLPVCDNSDLGDLKQRNASAQRRAITEFVSDVMHSFDRVNVIVQATR